MKRWCFMMMAIALVSCGDESPPTKGEAVDPVEVEVAGDAKADGSPWARYQGAIELDDRREAWLPRSTAYHMWTFEAPAGSELYIDVPSRDGDDLYLLLYRQTETGWAFEAGNDDCYSGTLDACLDLTTEDARYVALISTYSYLATGWPKSATYELEAFCNGGACAQPEPQLCGSRGLEPCPDGQYCDWEDDACGAADVPGICQPIPDVCPLHYAPVCGCDGQTYSNVCYASLDGVDVVHAGDCDPPGNGVGEICGGIAGFRCEDGLECDYSANEGCNIADIAGVCRTTEPMLCTQQYDPVCGCDGITYSNDCHRRGAGIPLDHPGECA